MRWFPLLVLVAACSTTPLPLDLQKVDIATFPIVDGTPEAVGLLAMLNDSATTFAILDDEVPLDRRAAENLMAARPFSSVGEVDDVYWVGASAINKMVAYATAQSYVPTANQILGVYDGVEFTVAQAEWTLEVVINDLEFNDFDIYMGLDRRAAVSIVAAQPVASIEELAGLYYVGTSALNDIKDYAREMDPSEWPVCVPTFTVTSNPAAEDLTELLVLATTVDNPFAEIISMESSGCSDWWTDTPDDAMQPLWDEIFFLPWSQAGPSYALVSDLQAGGAAYLSMLNTTLVVIDENIEDDDFDPSSAQELFDSRFDLIETLSVELDTNPGAYLTLPFELDLSECSEEANVLIDTRDGSVLIVHQLQNC
jgi:hypothetical protein